MSEEQAMETVTVEAVKPKRGRPKKQTVVATEEPAVETEVIEPEPEIEAEPPAEEIPRGSNRTKGKSVSNKNT